MSSFENYMNIMEGQEKVASQTFSDNGLLAKLAEELDSTPSAAAPTTEGAVAPADSAIVAANPTIVGQTEAVQAPQLALAGGDAEEAAAGEVPAETKPNQGVVISAGDGESTDANKLGKTPAAIAAAVTPAATAPAAPETDKTAELLGEAIATSFLGSIVKEAEEAQYQEALVMLKEAGLLADYEIAGDEMAKEASQEDETLGLEKIANKEELTREDMIKAAGELVELAEIKAEEEAMAKEAEDYGRQAAHDYVASAKVEQTEQEKVAELRQDPEVMAAMAVLKSRELI